MAPSVSFLLVLSCTLFAALCRADVSHLRNNNRYYQNQRYQTTRLQRLEAAATPYPAAGYRPNREFNIPREQPLFPLAQNEAQNFGSDNTLNSNEFVNNGFDNQEDVQQPQLTYGAPSRFRQQPQRPARLQYQQEQQQRQQQQLQYQRQQQQLQYQRQQQRQQYQRQQQRQQFQQQQQQQQFQQQQQQQQFQQQQQQQQFQQQQLYAAPPQLTYGEPLQQATQIQPRPARLRQQPQRLYAAAAQDDVQIPDIPDIPDIPKIPSSKSTQPQRLYATTARQESRAQRLRIAPKPERLTDNREDREDNSDDIDSSVDIETTNKDKSPKDNVDKKQSDAPLVPTVTYYPAGAVGFVHPLSAAYASPAASVFAKYQTSPLTSAAYVAAPAGLTSANYIAGQSSAASVTAQAPLASAAYVSNQQPFTSAAYVAAAPTARYVQQPFGQFIAPAKLQAW